MHYVKHHIISVLAYTKLARFRDMRPPKVDSNAYSYHLKSLIKEGLIEKTIEGYQLSPNGLIFADRMSSVLKKLRHQPKIITMMVIENEEAEVLLLPKSKQPFIGSWVLPHGKLHIEDGSIEAGANREFEERLMCTPPEPLRHVANAYIYAYIKGILVSAVSAHVFMSRVRSDQIQRADALWTDEWIRSQELELAPAVEEIINLAKSGDQAFAEFHVNW